MTAVGEALAAGAGVGVLAAVVAGGLAAVGARAPPAEAESLATGVLATGLVGTVLAWGALPLAGLLAPPLVPVTVAYAALGGAVRARPTWVTGRRSPWVVVGALAAGVLVLLARGIALSGPAYVGHVLDPPSLVLSSLALGAAALVGYPLGWTTRRGRPERWAVAALAVALPVATVGAAALRSYRVAGLLLPVASAAVAVLLGVGAFRLGDAVAAQAGPGARSVGPDRSSPPDRSAGPEQSAGPDRSSGADRQAGPDRSD